MARPKLTERLKVDVGVIPQTINNNNVTGPYYDMRGYEKAVLVCLDGASAVNKVTKVEFIQATNSAGTGAKVVKASNVSTATESAAANTAAAAKLSNVTAATITLSTMANTETLTVTAPNGVNYVFTAHTDTTTKASRQFSIAGTDAQDATALYGCLTDAAYGVPGLSFVDGGTGTLTVTLAKAGAGVFSLATNAIGHCVLATTQQVLVSEIDVGDLDIAGGFYWVAGKITKAGNGVVGATLLRTKSDYVTRQQTAAATVI